MDVVGSGGQSFSYLIPHQIHHIKTSDPATAAAGSAAEKQRRMAMAEKRSLGVIVDIYILY
jgi:hypothetical protein